ncbi:hypothetical protein, partial [Rhizobium leguminosarum]
MTIEEKRAQCSARSLLISMMGDVTSSAGVVTLFECGQVRPSLRFSGRPCTHGFPRGHCLASMGSN